MTSLDGFDLKILSALQDDGRLTNQQLADLAGLSASQCSRRRSRLEDEKIIAGYHADLASEALGFNVLARGRLVRGGGLCAHAPRGRGRRRRPALAPGAGRSPCGGLRRATIPPHHVGATLCGEFP